MAILDGEGAILATSDGPQGNIGFPAQVAEIDHFMGMLKKTAPGLSPAAAKEIETALRDASKQLLRR